MVLSSDGGGQKSDSSFVNVVGRQSLLAGEDDGEEEIRPRRVQINRKLHFPLHFDLVVGAEAHPLQTRHVQIRLNHGTQLEQVVVAFCGVKI